jgi:hypothetical protein
MMKPAIPTARIPIMNMMNPPKIENAGATEPLAIRVAEAAIIEKIKATPPAMAIMGKIILIRLA